MGVGDPDPDDEDMFYGWGERGNHLATALQEAVLLKNITLVRLFLDLGTDVNVMESKGTALQIAAGGPKKLNMVRLLPRSATHVSSTPPYGGGYTALRAAAKSGNELLVKVLLDAGAYVNSRPALRGGRTPLQAAVESCDIDLVRLLVNAGSDVNARPVFKCGRTCLEIACKNGNADMVDLLLELGADVNGPAFNGYTPLQVAISFRTCALSRQNAEATSISHSKKVQMSTLSVDFVRSVMQSSTKTIN